MKNRIISLLISVVILTAAFSTAGCSVGWKPSLIPEIGEVASDFRLEDLDGNYVSLSDYQGKPVLINFWATWCVACREEMPLFETIHNDAMWRDKELVILAVDIGEREATVRDFVEKYDISFTVLLDTERNVFLQYFVRGVPTTFFIDKEGIIQAVTIGAFANTKEIEKNLEKIVR